MLKALWIVSGILILMPTPAFSAESEISAVELLSRMDGGDVPLILDVRTPAEFASGRVPGAVNIPYDEIPTRLSELGSPTGREVVVYCKSGRRAGVASETLTEAGFQVLHLEGDMSEWAAGGHPQTIAMAMPGREALRGKAAAIFGALPANADSAENPYTDAKADLGRMLYFDKRLSKNHDVSCNSCHLLTQFGQDGEPTSPGHRGQRGGRNSPTVYNAAFHVAQFWDGRAPDVEAQAKGPVLNPIEMAMPSEAAVIAVLASIPEYVSAFSQAFPGEEKSLSYDNMARAIGAFERRLVTPNRFDEFVGGALSAIDDEEAAGLEKFIEAGCVTCHMGSSVGGMMYQKLGLVRPYPTEDPGRFDVTGNEADRYFFKVPSLRNIQQTGPYFHDGSITTLPEAIRLMADHQLGKELSNQDVQSIAAFLGSLTGTPDAEYIAEPTLPPSSAETPAPDPS